MDRLDIGVFLLGAAAFLPESGSECQRRMCKATNEVSVIVRNEAGRTQDGSLFRADMARFAGSWRREVGGR